jgi:hypothetical protein
MTDMPTSYPRSGNVCGDILSPQMRLFKVTEANARQRTKSSGNPFPDEGKCCRPRRGKEPVSMTAAIGGFAVIYYIYA